MGLENKGKMDLQKEISESMVLIDLPTTPRAKAMGKGREGVTPLPRDWGLVVKLFSKRALHALRPKASADLSLYDKFECYFVFTDMEPSFRTPGIWKRSDYPNEMLCSALAARWLRDLDRRGERDCEGNSPPSLDEY